MLPGSSISFCTCRRPLRVSTAALHAYKRPWRGRGEGEGKGRSKGTGKGKSKGTGKGTGKNGVRARGQRADQLWAHRQLVLIIDDVPAEAGA